MLYKAEEEDIQPTGTNTAYLHTPSTNITSSSAAKRNKQFQGYQTVMNSNIKYYGDKYHINTNNNTNTTTTSSSSSKKRNIQPDDNLIDTWQSHQQQQQQRRKLIVLSDSSEDENNNNKRKNSSQGMYRLY